ncbi:MAG: thioesterase family protein [Gammaproteobacteria bacterium]|nr:thioesterase family protein [Gammaproteobacteria bacterium]MBU2677933.1 thioesterase family protein [Gammaproteobacteria bacterium]NNC57018.1 thioesterase family protein [Woeseiaceae bacterium]NNL51666.1 thioesterase family protein [Woeseiaceae bacterium]
MPQSEMLGIEVVRGQVLPEWIDINNHMNVAYYVLAFDQGVDHLWTRFGISDEYIEDHRNSTFAVESHITWQREISEGEPYIVTSQILAYDDKRIHQFMRMYHANEGYLVATAEWMNLHVDLDVRRVAPWPTRIRERIAEYAAEQGEQPWPDEAGKKMHIEKPLFTAKVDME